jgi:Sec-independent protein secretion pathway component TatC
MLYFTEIFFRLLYVIFSIIITSSLIYYFKDETYFYLLYNESFNYSYYSLNIERPFVLRSPWELLNAEIYASFFLSIVFTLPFFFFNFILFVSSALNNKNYLKFLSLLGETTIAFYLSNIIFTFFIFPTIFPLLEGFILLENIKSFNIEYQPGIEFFLNLYNELIIYFNMLTFILFFVFRISFVSIQYFKIFLLYLYIFFLIFFVYLYIVINFSFIILFLYVIFAYLVLKYIIKFKIVFEQVLNKKYFYN